MAMAIPKNHRSIATNLPFPRLEAFLKALDRKKARCIPGSSSTFAESSACTFELDGATYRVNEFVETISSVVLESGKPTFVQTLIDELEAGVSLSVKERKFDEAGAINSKIESLQNILRV